ncbi:Apoptotic chromatin condensation inducer in the nucleus [Tyrophagus putrescentiae]|nr:Apoptotic chromatin condensation inducer in the nucleus [Tyrophagus putrescentiae]
MSPLSISNTKDSKSWWWNASNNDHDHQQHFDDQQCRQRSLSPSSERWSTPENSLEMTAFWTTPSSELSLEEEEALIEREKERTKMAAILELEDVFMEGEQQQQQHCQASAFSSLHHSPNATHQNINSSSSSSSSSSIIVKVYTPNEDFDDDCLEEERPATRTLHITHLVAPFDVHALKRQLEAFGPISEGHFWISRTQCFVHFESVEAAARARLALHRRRWPPASPRLLEVTFVEEGRHPACWRLRPMMVKRRR